MKIDIPHTTDGDIECSCGPLVLTVEADGSISRIAGGPLEKPVDTGPTGSVAARRHLCDGTTAARQLRRALRDVVHPTMGRCGPDSTGCRTRHHLAAEEALNLLGRGDFALARLLLHEHDTRLASESDR